MNVPDAWDLEADVVVIGSGIGGLSAAIAAHDHGASALVLEKSDQVGGVTALSVGQVWVAGNHLAAQLGIEDSAESGFRYLQRLSMGYGEEAMIRNLTVHARIALHYFEERIGLKMQVIRDCPDYYYAVTTDGVPEGRMLEVVPFPASSLGEWQTKTRVSPYVLYGMTHPDMFDWGGPANVPNWDYAKMSERLEKDERCLGPGLAAYFVKGALDRAVPLHTGCSAEQLVTEGRRVVGVRAQHQGRDVFVKASRGVVIATSSYEKNRQYNKNLGQLLDLESMLFPAIDGANLRLAGSVGARIAKVPDVTMIGFIIPGEEHEDGRLVWRPALQAMSLPHSITVNRQGKRFGNESFYRAICYAVDAIDGASQTHPNFPCWIIFDSQAREKYVFGSVMPGQNLPEGLGARADTIDELAQKIGVDCDGLAATIATFNSYCEQGEDPEFRRGIHPWSAWIGGDPRQTQPNLGALVKPPFYAVQMSRMGGSAIPSAGIAADEHLRVIGWDDAPIEGLYAAGNSVARMETGAVMQSGLSNARGMTHGYLAGRHAAGAPSEALQREIDRGMG